MHMDRVIAYIDGFNLYYGLRERQWKRYYWLDMPALVRSLLKSHQELVQCHYFTARISSGHGHQDAKRQTTWLEAVSTHGGVQIHFGKYLMKERRCQHCKESMQVPEEKMTDVNIATQLLVDAFSDAFDMALVISGDSDLAPPILAIRQHLPQKRVVIAFPPKRKSHDLRQAAHACIHIGADKLKHAQMPDQIRKPDGYVLQRPSNWR